MGLVHVHGCGEGLCGVGGEDILNIHHLITPESEKQKNSNRSILFRGANEATRRISLRN